MKTGGLSQSSIDSKIISLQKEIVKLREAHIKAGLNISRLNDAQKEWAKFGKFNLNIATAIANVRSYQVELETERADKEPAVILLRTVPIDILNDWSIAIDEVRSLNNGDVERAERSIASVKIIIAQSIARDGVACNGCEELLQKKIERHEETMEDIRNSWDRNTNAGLIKWREDAQLAITKSNLEYAEKQKALELEKALEVAEIEKENALKLAELEKQKPVPIITPIITSITETIVTPLADIINPIITPIVEIPKVIIEKKKEIGVGLIIVGALSALLLLKNK